MDRSRLRMIGVLSLPIIGGMVSQNVLNLVDIGMVGTQGDAALAAVGMGGFANFMAMAFITGMSAGVQAMASRRKGEGREDEMAVPLNGGLLIALSLAVPWGALLFWLAPSLFPFLINDPDVVAIGAPYLQARLVAMAAVGMNYAFRGYWNGVNRSQIYLRTLLVMHACNIFLNWVFIYGNLGAPELGAVGAGVASAIATWVGTLTYVLQGVKYARVAGFLRALPDRAVLRTMLRLSVPAGFQQFFMAAGFTAFFWIVGQVGTAELAAANVLLNVMLVAILPGIGLGLAAASLVGQALGRKDVDDAEAWGWDVVKVGVVAMSLLGLPMLLLPDLVLGAFLHDAATIDLARPAMRLIGGTIAFDAVGLILLNALLGAGDSRTVMIVGVLLQWGVGLTCAWIAGPVMGWGLLGVWGAQILYRAIQAGVFSVVWRRRKWAAIAV